jgi:hypothetical protein
MIRSRVILRRFKLAKKHRNAIIQGYTESDDEDLYSDDEAEKKKKAGGGGKNDDDDDMFAGGGGDDDSDDEKSKGKKGKKHVEFLPKDKVDLQGAEMAGEDEEDGIKIDPFNMDQELEEG